MALVAAALALPVVAHAEEAEVPEARTLFKEGVKLYTEHDYERARVKFAAAHALVKSEDIVWNLALAEAMCSHYPDALNHLRAYVRAPKARPSDVKEGRSKWIPELEPKVAELDVQGTAGMSVTVDGGDSIGVLPLADPWAVKGGHHRLVGTIGGTTVSREVDVAQGQTVGVSLVAPSDATPAPPPPPVPVAIAPAPPPAPEPVAATPPAAPPPVVEEHPYEARRPNPTRLWLTVGLGVGAVAAVAVGAVLGAESSSDASDAKSLRAGLPSNACSGSTSTACTNLTNDVHGQNTDETVSIVMYGAAGALAVGAVLSWVLLPKTVSDDRASVVTPMVGPHLAGGSWSFSF